MCCLKSNGDPCKAQQKRCAFWMKIYNCYRRLAALFQVGCGIIMKTNRKEVPVDEEVHPSDPICIASVCVCGRCTGGKRYYNPQGGRYYHSNAFCSSVSEAYQPLTAFPVEELENAKFINLYPCGDCVDKNRLYEGTNGANPSDGCFCGYGISCYLQDFYKTIAFFPCSTHESMI